MRHVLILVASVLLLVDSGCSSPEEEPMVNSSSVVTSGCWVDVSDNGKGIRINGPGEDEKLSDNLWPGKNAEMGDSIDSIATGPNTWFEGFGDEEYKGSVIKVGPGARHADLSQEEMGDRIDSYRIYDRKPANW